MTPSIAGNHPSLLAASYQTIFHQCHPIHSGASKNPNLLKGSQRVTITFYAIPSYVDKTSFADYFLSMRTGEPLPRHPSFTSSTHIAIFKHHALGTITFCCILDTDSDALTDAYLVHVSSKLHSLLFPRHRAKNHDVISFGLTNARDDNGCRFAVLELFTGVEEDSAVLYEAADEVIGALFSTRTDYHEFYAKKVEGGPVVFTEDEADRLGVDTEGWPWGWGEAEIGLVDMKIGRWGPGLETVEEGCEGREEESDVDGHEDDYDDGDFIDEGEEEELEELEWQD